MGAPLYIDFCGEVYTVTPGEDFTFGRSGDLAIDENKYLHRQLGVFRNSGGAWWLDNVGSAILIEVADAGSPSRMRVAPNSSVALGFAECVVRFQAGRSAYEIDVSVPIPEVPDRPLAHRDTTNTATVTAEKLGLRLTDDQLRCIVALSMLRLRDPSATNSLPTNREAAATLGWKITRFNRKLDNVCERLASAGVGGLHGDTTKLARDRRARLVEYAITTGLVTSQHLSLIDGLGEDAGARGD